MFQPVWLCPPWEERPSINDVDSDVVVFPELGVTPLIDSGTDLDKRLRYPFHGSTTLGILCRPNTAVYSI